MDIESKIYKPDNLVFNLKEIDKKQFPCIALIQKDNINHYIVLHKMLKEKSMFILLIQQKIHLLLLIIPYF